MFFDEYILEQEIEADKENEKIEDKLKKLKEFNRLYKNNQQTSKINHQDNKENEGVFSNMYSMFITFLNKSKEYIFPDIAENIKKQQQYLQNGGVMKLTQKQPSPTDYLVIQRINESNFQYVNKMITPDGKEKANNLMNENLITNVPYARRKNNIDSQLEIETPISFSVAAGEGLLSTTVGPNSKDKLENLLLRNDKIQEDSTLLKNYSRNTNQMPIDKNIYVLDNQILKETYGLVGQIYKDELKLGRVNSSTMEPL